MSANAPTSPSPLRTFATAWCATILCWACAVPVLGALPLLSVLFPPLGLSALKFHAVLLPFLSVPAALALAAAVGLERATRRHLRSVFVRAMVANLVFMATLVIAVEGCRVWWIEKEARAIGAHCKWSRPFVESVGLRAEHAPAHAMAFARGRYFIWSYSERRFVPDTRYSAERGCEGMPPA